MYIRSRYFPKLQLSFPFAPTNLPPAGPWRNLGTGDLSLSLKLPLEPLEKLELNWTMRWVWPEPWKTMFGVDTDTRGVA
jgi:hypothetical protein